MTAQWSDGYHTDTTYTYGYYQELSPAMQDYCLLLKGIAPPESDNLAYCELGFGQGISLNVHSAAVPGQYWGNDFNPSHVAFAHDLASHAGLGASLVDDSFEQFARRDDLPRFDYISLHGIWSWISPANRHHILNFIDKNLKPGGVLYISYNTLPGWAALSPLRQLLITYDRYAEQQRGTVARVHDALAFSQKVLEADPLYAASAPNAKPFLENLKNLDTSYLANEYFNEIWDSIYFLNMVDALAAVKMDFAASAVPAQNIGGMGLMDKAQQVLNQIPHPLMREQVRDFMVNQQFRKDIFVKGVRNLSPQEQTRRLMAQRYILSAPVGSGPLTIKAGMGTLTMDDNICRPLLAALEKSQTPLTAGEIHAGLGSTSPITREQVSAWLAALTNSGLVLPCQSEEKEARARATCAAFNAEVLRRTGISTEVNWMASPRGGTGVSVNLLHQAFLKTLALPGESDPAAFVQNILKNANQHILVNGEAIVDEQQSLAAIRTQLEEFRQTSLPFLDRLGLV